jgi:hypothetical protein
VAAGHVDAETNGVFDTWGADTGLEYRFLGGALPFRLGARYGTLPFSPTAEQPTEWTISAGLGTRIARGRLGVDFSVERLIREGGGARERGWNITLGLAVQP